MYAITAVLVVSLMLGTTMAAVTNMRVVTYNLRYDSQPDNLTVQDTFNSLPDPLVEPKYLAVTQEKPWSTRRIRIAHDLLSAGIDIACFQEALVRQVNDLAELFGSDWDWYGLGRDDGIAAGEFSPIFYRKDVLKQVSRGTFWLSDDPFNPSKYPEAGSLRLCTAMRFAHVASGKYLTILNVHLDDQSDQQRRLAASMLLMRAKYEAFNTGAVFVIGDFNSPPNGRDSGAYSIITGATPPVPVNQTFADIYDVDSDKLPDFHMIDLRTATLRQNVSGNYATFTGFTAPQDTKEWERIDFIFGGNNWGWYSNRYIVGTALSDDGILSSDHRPVYADISV
ncbi:Endonuclease/exonuclease/phosphatase [Amanita muscaria]